MTQRTPVGAARCCRAPDRYFETRPKGGSNPENLRAYQCSRPGSREAPRPRCALGGLAGEAQEPRAASHAETEPHRSFRSQPRDPKRRVRGSRLMWCDTGPQEKLGPEKNFTEVVVVTMTTTIEVRDSLRPCPLTLSPNFMSTLSVTPPLYLRPGFLPADLSYPPGAQCPAPCNS